MSSSITIQVPEALADSAKVIVPHFTNYPNWRNVMIVGIPLSLGVAFHHWCYKGKNFARAMQTGVLRLSQFSLFAVGLHWLSGREPIEISVGAIKEALRGKVLEQMACPVAENMTSN